MKILITILRELWGLFIDDGSLALALVLWCVIVGLILPRAVLLGDWNAPALFLGCILILLMNVASAARRLRSR
jgi:hypothetical protein